MKNFFIKILNNKMPLYESVYSYVDSCDIFHVLVDKIFLDFDFDENFNFLKDIRIVSRYLYENNIKFCIRFSGRGFHLFIYLSDDWLQNPKRAIKQFVKSLHEKTNTKSDPAVVGDLRRVVRIPFTVNKKTNLYCMPITYDDLMNKNYEEICDMAKDPIYCFDIFYGEKLLDISSFDKVPTVQLKNKVSVAFSQITNDIPLCIKNLMKDPYASYNDRFLIIMFFRELGYSEDEIVEILKNCLSEEKFEHCVYEEHQVEYLMEREELFFPACYNMKNDGYCPDQKCKGHCLYY